MSGSSHHFGANRAATLVALGLLCGLAVHRHKRSDNTGHNTGHNTGRDCVRVPPGGSGCTTGAAHALRRKALPADRQKHDGRSDTQRQLVFLEGGPQDGARVALDWQAAQHQVIDADRGTCTYLDSGRTRPDALGEPARIFVAH